MIASAFGDLDFEIDLGVLFQTAEEVAKAAMEAKVDLIGVSSQAAGQKVLVPQLINVLQDMGADIPVIVGGVIPPDDYPFLQKAGVLEILV